MRLAVRVKRYTYFEDVFERFVLAIADTICTKIEEQ